MLRKTFLSLAVLCITGVAAQANASSFDREHNGKSTSSATTTSTTATPTTTGRFGGIKAMQAAPGNEPVIVNTAGDQTDGPVTSFDRERGAGRPTAVKAGVSSAPPPAVEKTVQ